MEDWVNLREGLLRLFLLLNINCVIDVGANAGGYGDFLRDLGYEGWIVSLEPVESTYNKLRRHTAGDPKWSVHRIAAGAEDKLMTMNVTRSSVFSSFLTPDEFGRKQFPGDATVERRELVPMRRLDGIFPDIVSHIPDPRVYLKLDTQGWDLQALEGASGILGSVAGLQSELSVQQIYEGMPTYTESLAAMERMGFELVELVPVSRKTNRAVIEFDALLTRSSEAFAGPSYTKNRVEAPESRSLGLTRCPMSNPLVSIIIPTYNRAYVLQRAVDSVLTQTHSRCEAVIVDDGSTDGTDCMVRERYGRDARVRYLRQENAGVSTARNRGIAEARGDYIALLDSDDWWEPWKLELQLACFRHCPQLGMVWTEMSAVNAEGKVVDRRYLKTMYAAYRYFSENDLFTRTYPIGEVAPPLAEILPGARLMTGDIFSQMILGNMVHTSTVLLTRERVERVKGFRVDLVRSGEDYDFHLRTCREGLVGFVDYPSVGYQVSMPDQLTARSYSIDSARNFLKTIEPVIARDRARIRLPERMIRHSLAYGHCWLGRELLFSRSSAPARSHLVQSMRQEWSLDAAALYAMSLLPGGAIDLLRSARRACLRVSRPQQSTN